jgi:hypothetical protein
MMEADLATLLAAICERVFPDVAPPGTEVPYLTWQAFGGESIRYGDGTPPDKRNTGMQINAWASSRLEALQLIHQVEDAVCAATSWQAKPLGEAVSDHEADTQRYGSKQRFNIWAPR